MTSFVVEARWKCAKVGSKLLHLDAEYNFALVEVGVNLVVFVDELELSIVFGFNVFDNFLGET